AVTCPCARSLISGATRGQPVTDPASRPSDYAADRSRASGPRRRVPVDTSTTRYWWRDENVDGLVRGRNGPPRRRIIGGRETGAGARLRGPAPAGRKRSGCRKRRGRPAPAARSGAAAGIVARRALGTGG